MIVLGQYFFSPQQFVLDSLGVTAAQFQGITLVHEALHSYSGLGDADLASYLGLGTFGRN
jgi:hypothetical protein